MNKEYLEVYEPSLELLDGKMSPNIYKVPFTAAKQYKLRMLNSPIQVSKGVIRVAKVPLNEDTKSKCICGSCPTFSQNSLKGGVFCAAGKSEKAPEMKGCVCTKCGVFAEYKLTGGYFCINGAAE